MSQNNFRLKTSWAGFPAGTVYSEVDWKLIIATPDKNLFPCDINLSEQLFEPIPDPKWPQVWDDVYRIYGYDHIDFWIERGDKLADLFDFKSRSDAEEVLQMIKEKREELGYD